MREKEIGRFISMVYLSQSFLKVPKFIRSLFNYLILIKLSSDRDLNLILSNFSLGVDRKVVLNIYKDATKQKFNFLKVSLDEPDINKRFCKNWIGYYKVEDVEDNEDTDTELKTN